MSKRRIAVVGAGFTGLASAALLARAGFDVTIIEKNDRAGGRAMVFDDSGFRFDMGPSWYLMPDVFERFFGLFGKKPSDFYTLHRLDPAYRVFFGSESVSDVSADLTRNIAMFESFEPGGGRKFEQYLAKSSYKYDVAMSEFLYKSYTSIFDFMNWRLLTEGPRMKIFDNLDRFARRTFSSDKARKILLYNTVFLGGDPKNTPALYSIMSHVDFKLGVWYPMGGMGSVVDGVMHVARDHGVTTVFDADVTRVSEAAGGIKRIETTAGVFEAEQVVVTGDYPSFEQSVLNQSQQSYTPKYWNKRVLAPSAMLLYLGVRRRVSGLAHHNLSLADNWDLHFDEIFRSPQWPSNPSYYVCCPSQTDPSVAPEGMENIFVLVPVAPGLDDNDELREAYRARILEHLVKLIGDNFRGDIVTSHIITHRDFAELFRAFKGTALGLAHTLFQSAFFRPAHRSKKIAGMYYGGQYTHPGIGVPMTLIAAEVVSDLVRRDAGAK